MLYAKRLTSPPHPTKRYTSPPYPRNSTQSSLNTCNTPCLVHTSTHAPHSLSLSKLPTVEPLTKDFFWVGQKQGTPFFSPQRGAYRSIFHHFSRSTRLSFLSTAPNPQFNEKMQNNAKISTGAVQRSDNLVDLEKC